MEFWEKSLDESFEVFSKKYWKNPWNSPSKIPQSSSCTSLEEIIEKNQEDCSLESLVEFSKKSLNDTLFFIPIRVAMNFHIQILDFLSIVFKIFPDLNCASREIDHIFGSFYSLLQPSLKLSNPYFAIVWFLLKCI